jgi:pyrophosphatase PpaX
MAGGIEAVLFDCDGVLVDSRAASIATYQNVLEYGGYARPSEASVAGCYHLPGRETLERLSGTVDTEELRRLAGFLALDELRETGLIKKTPGIETVLESLRTNHALGVVTSRSELGMKDVMKSTGLNCYFDTIVQREDYRHPKPNPEPLYIALGRLNISGSKAVYIGDSDCDIEAAFRAGVPSIHLTESLATRADIRISHIQELPEVLSCL